MEKVNRTSDSLDKWKLSLVDNNAHSSDNMQDLSTHRSLEMMVMTNNLSEKVNNKIEKNVIYTYL